jgi:hypothetical protein
MEEFENRTIHFAAAAFALNGTIPGLRPALSTIPKSGYRFFWKSSHYTKATAG